MLQKIVFFLITTQTKRAHYKYVNWPSHPLLFAFKVKPSLQVSQFPAPEVVHVLQSAAHAKNKENIVLQWSLTPSSILHCFQIIPTTYTDRQNRLTDHQVHLISHISKHFAIHPHWNTLSLPTLQYRERQREREREGDRERERGREGERERGREGDRERGREGEREREREREREQILLSMSTIIKNHYISVDIHPSIWWWLSHRQEHKHTHTHTHTRTLARTLTNTHMLTYITYLSHNFSKMLTLIHKMTHLVHTSYF